MSTSNKNFKVKNGLVVAEGATFGSSISIGEPTTNDHATTKFYVDSAISSVSGGASLVVDNTEPESPSNGDLWLDTTIDRLKIRYSDDWIILATYEDSQSVTQHNHDTSIDGTGFVVDVFKDSPAIGEMPILYIDGGSANTTVFEMVLDGGIV